MSQLFQIRAFRLKIIRMLHRTQFVGLRLLPSSTHNSTADEIEWIHCSFPCFLNLLIRSLMSGSAMNLLSSFMNFKVWARHRYCNCIKFSTNQG